MSNPDTYYQRSEVSNSDLTSLKNLLHPVPMPEEVRLRAFRFGTLVDAIITEPARVDHFLLTVDGEPYDEEDFRLASEMNRSLHAAARKDPFLDAVLKSAETQTFMTRQAQPFTYGELPFTLDTRCKWDWWLPDAHFGGDLKTTAAATQKEFEACIDFFDWDRSRAWYMDIAGSHRDFIYAISKKNCNVFKAFIERDDRIYRRGREKYEELAFQYWCLTLPNL